jgi:uncharacterized protein (DUF885 family)
VSAAFVALAAVTFGTLSLVSLPAAAHDETTAAAATSPTDAALQRLYGDYYDWTLEVWGRIANPDGSTDAGPALPSVTPQAHAERVAALNDFLARLNAINEGALSPVERNNAIVLRTLLNEQLGDARFREWEMPFDSDRSFWTYLNPRRGFAQVEDYERYISRMRDVPRYFAENIANARTGLARGFSVPRVTLAGRDVSIESFITDTAEDNAFWTAFADMPGRIPAAEQARLRAEGAAAIREAVIPAYRDLLAFMREDYLPNTRTTLGASEFPDGDAYYQQQLRQYTTLDLTAEQIHRTGLQEVARIEAAMQAIMDEVGFEGSLSDFTQALRTDPQFIADTPEQLMGFSSYVAKRVDGKLADYFGFLPRHRFTIRPVEPSIAPFYTAGRGGLDACQMNTYDLPSRPLYNIPALTLHECAPGHSFQAGVALEQEDAPLFRRQTYFSGFGEGWGLYVEYLGNEMGIYRTPYERFGQLSYEMWRAVRLVIDTGLHQYGWSREQAMAYLAERTALSDREVGTEIDRYISWPGQATAYKLGEMTIRRLRNEAEEKLGPDFDIRKFHDVILSLGSVPLPALETRIEAFVASGGEGLPGVRYD